MEKGDAMDNRSKDKLGANVVRPQVPDKLANRPRINGRGIFAIVLCYTIMTVIAIACLIIRLLLLGRGENFCRMHIIRPLTRLFLRLIGITVVYPEQEYPAEQVIYTLNHSSTMDNFLVAAMGLSNTRYFLSWYATWKVIPLTITSLLQGTFYTPSQNNRAARVRCFQHAEKVLRKTGYSTILSPEGERVCTGEIGKFNKGTFHLATNLKLPIVPVYFYIPHNINPWATFYVKPGQVVIELLPEVNTAEWSLEKLDKQREFVRTIYVNHHTERHRYDEWS